MISFVVPAHNEAELLGRTLAALIASARTVGQPWEAVVVNDTSVPDNTPGYVTVGPDTVGVTFAAPCSPYAIACEPSNRTEVSAASSADPA